MGAMGIRCADGTGKGDARGISNIRRFVTEYAEKSHFVCEKYFNLLLQSSGDYGIIFIDIG